MVYHGLSTTLGRRLLRFPTDRNGMIQSIRIRTHWHRRHKISRVTTASPPLICRWQSNTATVADDKKSKISVAIVGSGPSGCYTAKYLQSSLVKKGYGAKLDVIEKLPTPYGLVRSGVAPDHPEVKNVQNDFSALFSAENGINFKGNVNVGKDISLDELRAMYDVVVLAYGCDSDRKLGIPGEDTLRGVLSAREFVAWYNGHPDYGHIGALVEDLLSSQNKSEKQQVVVIGQGNVALDCARIMAKGSSHLVDTDIASSALEVLKNGVQSTVVLGRRGHVQGAFTIKEIRELTKLRKEGVNALFLVRRDELDLGMTHASKEELEGPGGRPKTRIDKLLRQAAESFSDESTLDEKEISLRFLLNPVEFLPHDDDPSTLGKVVCERTKLEGEPGNQSAVGTGEFETFPAQMALVSIGYKGVALDGMQKEGFFDPQRGVVNHVGGKVAGAAGSKGGLYTAGWLKRGPSGIIGTNIMDAKDTVITILKDLAKQPIYKKGGDIDKLLEKRGVSVVTWPDYQNIDSAETRIERKRTEVQPREKFTTINELLVAAGV